MFNRLPVRKIAKGGLEIVVSANAAAAANHVIDEHTSLDADSTAADVGCTLFGAYVAHRLSPITDAIVDKTADRIVAFRNRKNTESTES